MVNVVIYARVSTDEQELTQQIEACRKYCETKQLTIVQIYSDRGSGKDFFNRPDFLRMRENLHKFDGIVVFRLDRLGRDMRGMVNFLADMEKENKQIFSIHESFDTSSAMGRAVLGFMLVLAQLEREMISEATKQRLQAKKEAGQVIGRKFGSVDKSKRRRSGYFARWEKWRIENKRGK